MGDNFFDYDPGLGNDLRSSRRTTISSSKARQSALFHFKSIVTSRSGRMSTIQEVTSSNPITLLFFGTPRNRESRELVQILKDIQQHGQRIGRNFDVIYIPLYTFEETREEVEEDFQKSHGDWWIVPFMSRDAQEARYVHEVCVVPTVVVLDQNGFVITQCGQNDLREFGHNVLTTWF